jgi:hypothetical protein
LAAARRILGIVYECFKLALLWQKCFERGIPKSVFL